jgi:hypothetical protein
VNYQETVVLVPRDIHQHHQDTTEKSDEIVGLLGAERKRFAPSPRRAPWDRSNIGNRDEDEEEMEQPNLMPATTDDTEETALRKATTNTERSREKPPPSCCCTKP